MIDSIYLLALVAPVLALVITRAYDKFEKKDYSKKIYAQIGIMSYLSTVVLLYLLKRFNIFFKSPNLPGVSDITPNIIPGNVTAMSPVTNVVEKISTSVPKNCTPAPWNNQTPTTSDTNSSLVGNVINNIKQAVKSTTQFGGSKSNLVTPGNEVFHTGKPTF